MKRFLIFISMILILIISIGMVAAADDSTNGIDSSIEDSNINEESPLTTDHSVSGTTFDDIQDSIDESSTGDKISLENKVYTGSSNSQIQIENKDSLTVYGNGATLDGNGITSIFKIYNSNSIAFYDISFINGRNSTYDGGAIHISYANNTSFVNCRFISNSVGEYKGGGAVYCGYGTNNYSFVNCSFIGNSADGSSSHGGAIYTTNALNGTLINCNFTDNSALGRFAYGGAIDNYDNLSLVNCSFINNTAQYNGGALLFNLIDGNIDIINCSFKNNTLKEKNGYGEDIWIYSEDPVNLIDCRFGNYNDNSIFDDDKFNHHINAVNLMQDSFHDFTELRNLIADNDVIDLATDFHFVFGDDYNPIIIDKNLTINGNKHILSGANLVSIFKIVKGATLTINNAVFLNATCPIVSEGKVNITDSIFMDNSLYLIEEWEEFNGISAINSTNELYLSRCNFTSNNGASTVVYAKGKGSISSCNFRNHNLVFYEDGESIIYGNILEIDGKVKVSKSSFSNNNASIIDSKNNVTIDSCNFNKNYVCNRNLIELVNSTLSNSRFLKNTMANITNYRDWDEDSDDPFYHISTVFVDGESKIINSTFINSSSMSNGAAVSVKYFRNYSYYDYGIYADEWDNVLIENCSFINCSSEKSGGAIAVNSYNSYKLIGDEWGNLFSHSNLSINNCRFENNSAKYGGAIYISYDVNSLYGTCNLLRSNFTGNLATKGFDIYNMGVLNLLRNKISSDENAICNRSTVNYLLDSKLDLDYVGENLIVSLTNIDDEAITGEYVTININNVNITKKTDSKGQITIHINESSTVKAYYKDKSGETISSSMKIKLVPVVPVMVATSINASAMTTVAKTKKNLVLALKDANGKLLANKKIKVSLNGKLTTVTTNANGKAYVKTNFSSYGTYYYALYFLGDESYKACFKTVKVTVKKQATKAVFKARTFKKTATKKISFTLKDASGKIIKGKKITFKVNKKTYTATTNSKGIATVTIKITKKGKYLATAKFAGDKAYKAITKKAYITIK